MITKKQIISYIDAMNQSAEIFNTENPDFIVAPMLGSIPFIDAMSIVSRDFDPSKVVYMPASSRISKVSEVIRAWYGHFLDSAVSFPHVFPSVMGIDEVVSGSSVMRCLKEIDTAVERKDRRIKQDVMERVHSGNLEVSLDAIRDVDMLTDNEHVDYFSQVRKRIEEDVYRENRDLAREDSRRVEGILRNSLPGKINYRTIGVEDSKCEGKRNGHYEEMKRAGRVIPVSVDSIITMDKPSLCPARFEEISNMKRNGYVRFSPRIKDFVVTPQYIEFLRTLAKYVGKNPDGVSPVNMSPIFDSSRYLGDYH